MIIHDLYDTTPKHHKLNKDVLIRNYFHYTEGFPYGHNYCKLL